MIPAKHRPRDARPMTAQLNSLNELGDSRCYALCQRQINLSKVVTSDIILRMRDKDPLHLEISPFIHFMVQILFHKSNDI